MTDGVRSVSGEARRDEIGKYGLPSWLNGKESTRQSRRLGRCRFDHWIRKIPWRKKWQPIPAFLPEKNPMDRGDLQATVHGVAESQTRLSDRLRTDGQIHKRRHYLQTRKNNHLLQEEKGITMGVYRDYQDNYLIFSLLLEFGKLSHSRWLTWAHGRDVHFATSEPVLFHLCVWSLKYLVETREDC